MFFTRYATMNRLLRAIALPLLCSALSFPTLSQASLVLENGLTEERTMQPGEQHQGSLRLRNTDPTPVEIKVYQTDYSFSADGSTSYGKPGQLPRSNARWLSLSGEQYVIPPGGQIVIDYSLHVPGDAALTGTYWSMVMVEPIAPDSPEASGSKRGEVRAQLTQVIRYGIQMVTHIADSGSRQLVFENLALNNDHGNRLLTVDLKNTGERWLRPQVWVELHSSDGQPLNKLDGQQQRIYPATSARFRVDLSGVPSGHYVALVVADGGGDDLFGTQLELNLR